jgi:4-hydroxythreonine-4-phosphate dehydrogenase
MRGRRVAISIGCPGGVGAEVTLGALATTSDREVLFGDRALLEARAPLVGFDPRRLISLKNAAESSRLEDGQVGVVQVGARLSDDARRPGRSTREGGAAQLAWIDAACDAVARGESDAMVTAPASKEAIAHAFDDASRAHEFDATFVDRARAFRGHTEHLGARLGDAETVMAFVADALIISLATTHLALGEVARRLRSDDVARAAYWTARLVDDLDVDRALSIAVLALNPHAGEGGLLGDEERSILAPGIEAARRRLADEKRARSIVGPIGAEGAIRRTVKDRAFAACVAMYHDQATIPSKLVGFGESVNVTLGLPIVRTSVDHGTAYDLAGTGKADARGMRAAIDLARRLIVRA